MNGCRESPTWFLAAFFLAVLLAVGSAGELSKPANTVGFANCFGEVQFTGHLGSIEFSKSEVYDLYYLYGTFEELNSPYLGRGFSIPLLESKVIDHDYFLEFTTLGGTTIFTYRRPQDPTRYASLNGQHQVKKAGKSIFQRITSDGFKLEYREGKLARFQTPKGAVMTLQYREGLCTGLTGVGPALAFTKINELTHEVTNRDGKFRLELQPYPNPPDPELVAAGLAAEKQLTLARIHWPDGELTSFEYSTGGNREQQQFLTMAYRSQELDLAWDKSSGLIRSVGDVIYSVSPLSRTYDPAAERIQAGSFTVRRDNGLSWHSLTQTEDIGLTEESSSHSPNIRTHFVTNRGPAYNKVKKRERQVAEAEDYETFYRAFYDSKGRLLREIDDGQLRLHVWPGDDMDKIRPRGEDDLLRYDESDRLVYSRRSGVERTRNYGLDGVYREVTSFPWGEVLLQHKDARGRPVPFPAGEKFEEGRRLQ